MVKVTVYIPTFNYADYVAQAIDSVIAQQSDDWELIVIDDGSTDHTAEVLAAYEGRPRIRIVRQANKGLNVTNNVALRLARGRYVMRLDADDYLDENALVVLSNILDGKPEVGLVYPDYYEVDADGNIIELVRRKKIEDEGLLDLPAHGACTMFRRDVLMQLGGYAEDYACQDGQDIWLRFIRHFRPYNVNVPLFYYRRHGAGLTDNGRAILDTQRRIKRDFVAREMAGQKMRVLGIVPVDPHSPYPMAGAMVELAGKPLIWYTLDQALKAGELDRLVVSTGDAAVIDYVAGFPGVEVVERGDAVTPAGTGSQKVALHTLDALAAEGYVADAVCMLYVNTPLRAAHHIDWAIDTMRIFGVDSVISAQEELAPCYGHGESGLKALRSVPGVRLEREAIYKENGAVIVTRTEVVRGGRLLGATIGHLLMLPEESVKINSEYEFWLAERILGEWWSHQEH